MPEKDKIEKNNEEEDKEADKIIDLLKDDILIFAQSLVKDYEIGDYIVRAIDGVDLRIKEGE